MKTVFVKGNIIADCGYHSAKRFECLSRIEDADSADVIIEGDLHLNKEKTLIPYYSYKASGGITAIDGNIGWFSDPHSLQEDLSKELEKIVALSKIELSEDLQQIEYKSLYGAVFSCFEAFITMLLTNLVLGDKDYYERFLLYIKSANYKGSDIIVKIVKEINKFTAHNLKIVKSIYENVFEIEFPDYSHLKDVIDRRHDIIHRSSRKVVENHTEVVDITCDEIANLVEMCNDFVKKIMEAMDGPIKKWEE